MNSEFPDTRASLLLHLRTREDDVAWQDFVTTYQPVIYRIARRRGLQDADAQDLAQTVLFSVANAIPNWEKRDESIRFRHWLRRIARNAILNALTRGPKDAAVGGTAIQDLLANQTDSESFDNEIALEHRRELFFRAAAVVRSEVAPDTWQVFQLAVIENNPIEDVAKQLQKTMGAAYACRGRVMNRLRRTVQQLEENES